MCRDLLEWTEEGEISIIPVGSNSIHSRFSQAPRYFANWHPKFPEKMSIDNSNWATEKDHNGETKLGNLTNIMGYMLQRAWLNQTASKFDLIEFKKEDKGSEVLLTNPNLRLVGHQMKYQGPIDPFLLWHFKRWVRLTVL